MKKTIKCGIAAAVLVAAGFTAYQSYSSYGVQDNSLLMQNVEALASGADAEGDSDNGSIFASNIKLFASLSSGVCGYEYDKYEISVSVNGASQKFVVGLMPGGKYITEAGAEVNFPNIEWTKKMDGKIRVEKGAWKVCERSLADIFNTCDRCLQQLCDGRTGLYCETDLNKPNNALD